MKGIPTKIQRVHENRAKARQNDKKKETITKITRKKKIEEGHLMESVW